MRSRIILITLTASLTFGTLVLATGMKHCQHHHFKSGTCLMQSEPHESSSAQGQ